MEVIYPPINFSQFEKKVINGEVWKICILNCWIFQNEMLYYCFCNDYKGCIQHDFVRKYCKLCQINQIFTDFEEILRGKHI